MAGLILLIERPVQVGDTVTVGGTTGTVSRIRARSTTILDSDRKDLIVPNRELVTGRVLNWTRSDPSVRLQVPVGVAYGSDPAKVEGLLLAAARGCPSVLAEPAPSVVFERFGDSTLDFRLYAFAGGPEAVLPALHELHTAVERALREAGIQISFPQRDVHLDAKGPLDVRLVGPEGPAPPRRGRKPPA
jgi:potassium efflux system protein